MSKEVTVTLTLKWGVDEDGWLNIGGVLVADDDGDVLGAVNAHECIVYSAAGLSVGSIPTHEEIKRVSGFEFIGGKWQEVE